MNNMNSKNIKSFSDFFSSKPKGCVMIKVECTEWKNLGSIINKDDLYTENDKKGLDTDPHITVLYGLYEDVKQENIEEILKNYKTPTANGTDISVFEANDYDILKIGIESEDLANMNALLSALPHASDHPIYKPHLTVAYIKKGCAQKYLNLIKVPEFTLTDCVYSDPDKNRTNLRLNNE